MPLYIESKYLVDWCNEMYQKQTKIMGKEYCNAFLHAVVVAPTADVVPKSECAECAEKTRNTIVKLQGIINRLKKYDEQRDIELHARLIAETREKVAKEIFEGIEKKSCVISETNHSTGSTRVVCYQILAEKLAELKKKYTKGESNGSKQ